MNVRRSLVTGGAGFIGSHLVDSLVADGIAVTILDDFSTGDHGNLAEAAARGDVRIVEGSVLDADAVALAMQDCGTVYHLAVECVRRSLSQPLRNHEVNATGTLQVLEAARRAKVDRVLYCSSSEVYGNASDKVLPEDTTVCEPVTVYGAAKLAGEYYAKAYLRTYGLPVVIARPFNSYGPREHDQGDIAEVIPRFVIRVLNGMPPVVFGDGTAGRDFTYVTETADALKRLAMHPGAVGRVVNLAFGRMVTIAEVAQAVCVACGKPGLRPEFAKPRPGDVHRLHADTRQARELLGFAAAIDFERGLALYVEWFRRRHLDPSRLLEAETVNWRMPE